MSDNLQYKGHYILREPGLMGHALSVAKTPTESLSASWGTCQGTLLVGPGQEGILPHTLQAYLFLKMTKNWGVEAGWGTG